LLVPVLPVLPLLLPLLPLLLPPFHERPAQFHSQEDYYS
jgi:hypothetical protein